ncbi:MAG: carbamoyltransferase N-terminal domain-containing protein, partial [Cyanobacteria bacterium P01_E01_bin.43]
MIILGIHGGFRLGQHDPAAALLIDGELAACIEEERLLRVKTPRGASPIEAIDRILKETGISMRDIDLVAHPGETYQDAPARIEAYFRHYFGHAPKIQMVNHQVAHLASAFFMSGHDSAMVLSYDGFGDRLSAALAQATRDKGIEVLETRDHRNSLGLFYATITSFLGFTPDEDEYKVMGLAAYGEPNYDLSFFATTSDDGFQVHSEVCMSDDPSPITSWEPFYSEHLIEKLGPPRAKGEKLEQRHMDIAASTQKQLVECAKSAVNYLHKLTDERNLCLAGGVALNCAANNHLLKLDCVDDLFVQPAASDRGLALGCALQVAFESGDQIKPIPSVFYGPTYQDEQLRHALKLTGTHFEELEDPCKQAAELLADGHIIAWYQGRSEFGPRALGNRSILADPRRAEMKDLVNARIKYREDFRPFAPAVLEEKAKEVFDLPAPSPFMTIACG